MKKQDNTPELETTAKKLESTDEIKKRVAGINRNITLYAEQIEYLETVSIILGVSQAEIIRRAIDEYRVNHKDELTENLSELIDAMKLRKLVITREPSRSIPTGEENLLE